MENQPALRQIIDGVLPEDFLRVAKISLSPGSSLPCGKGALLRIVSSGDYSMTMSLQMDADLLDTLEKSMRRSVHQLPPGPQLYAEELFNLLCGRIISQINRVYHMSARFSTPHYAEVELPACPTPRLSACYASPAGSLCLGIDSVEEKLDPLFS